MGTALIAFLNAELRPGIDVVLEETQFKQRIKDANLVVTGEGKMDKQTIYGKTPIGVAKVAKSYDIPVIAKFRKRLKHTISIANGIRHLTLNIQQQISHDFTIKIEN